MKVQLLAQQTSLNDGPPSDYQTMEPNGYLRMPTATVELQIGVRGEILNERFIVLTN